MKEGFHVVYYNLTHEYGNPASIKAGTDFYNSMVSLYGFSPKVAMEGLSRGGYYALQWAVANPDKVASLYLDNPVCDIFSWPGKNREKEWCEFVSLWGLENLHPSHLKEIRSIGWKNWLNIVFRFLLFAEIPIRRCPLMKT